MGDDEFGGGPDVFAIRLRVGSPELLRQDERIGHFVKLQRSPVRPAVEPRVLRKRSVRFLLHAEQIIECPLGGGAIAHPDESGRGLVQIAGPDEMVAADVAVAGVHLVAPRNGHARDDRAPERLVFVRAEDHRRHRVLVGVRRVDRLEPCDVPTPSAGVRLPRRVHRLRQRVSPTGHETSTAFGRTEVSSWKPSFGVAPKSVTTPRSPSM